MIKVVVFDIGNVVWHFRPTFNRLFTLWGSHLGCGWRNFRRDYYEKDKIYRLFETNHLTIEQWCGQLSLPANTFQLDVNKILADRQKLESYFDTRVVDLISRLRQSDLPVICLSNTENFIYPFFEHYILPLFDHHILSWQVGTRKPNSEIYQQIFKYINCLPSEVLFIDDKESNVHGAREVGLNTIHFTNYAKLIKDLKKYQLFHQS